MILGVGIWVGSPWLLGTVEPWDAAAPVWALSWLALGVAGGLAPRLSGLALPAGYALGQMLVTIRALFVSEFGILGWLFIGGYALAAALVTLAVAGLRWLLRRR